MSWFRIDRTCPRVVSVMHEGQVVVGCCHVADRRLGRFIGLLGTGDLGDGEGLWLSPCASVHTWGMRIAIACAFVDGQGRVLRVVDPLSPWRVASCRGAAAVLEARVGAFASLEPGAVLTHGPNGGPRPVS